MLGIGFAVIVVSLVPGVVPTRQSQTEPDRARQSQTEPDRAKNSLVGAWMCVWACLKGEDDDEEDDEDDDEDDDDEEDDEDEEDEDKQSKRRGHL